MTAFQVFIVIVCVVIIGTLFMPGLMGVLTGTTVVTFRGRTTIYQGPKGVAVGLGMIIPSACLLIAFYFMVARSTTRGPLQL